MVQIHPPPLDLQLYPPKVNSIVEGKGVLITAFRQGLETQKRLYRQVSAYHTLTSGGSIVHYSLKK